MKLGGALLAVNDNYKYYWYWPIVKRAWKEIIGVPVVLVYIGSSLPDMLHDDPDVVQFVPIAGMPTATQAQMIRLLYPALLKTNDAVVIGDIDCMPLHKAFFHQGVRDASSEKFVSYRQPINDKELCMMYVAATPAVWGEVFGVRELKDVYSRLHEWALVYKADGKHDGIGWISDQVELYSKIMALPSERKLIHSWAYDFPRLDRSMPLEWQTDSMYLDSRIYYDHYIDFHMPNTEYEYAIQHIIEKAVMYAKQKRYRNDVETWKSLNKGIVPLMFTDKVCARLL